jgi:hypothetical protein
MTWMLTHSGMRFDFGAPKPSMVRIEDVAWHLALLNRFTGATRRPYSVAEHSLLVAEILERDAGVRDPLCLRAALLHDAHEAYLGDISTPLKAHMGAEFHACEGAIQRAVHQHFGIFDAALHHHASIKHADLVALATERRDLMPAHAEPWAVLRGVRPVSWIDLNDREGMEWDDWRLAFLDRHEELAARCEAIAP